MSALPRDSRLSVKEYLALDRATTDGRYEYYDGDVRLLAGGSPNHAKVAANLIGALLVNLGDKRCGVFTSDARVQIAARRYVYPDVTVSCDDRDQIHPETLHYPCLVIEVLSPATEAFDRGRKLAYYRACPSIQEYALVDAQSAAVEIFRREHDGQWSYHTFGAGDTVELASVGVSFPVALVYRLIELPPEEPEPPDDDEPEE